MDLRDWSPRRDAILHRGGEVSHPYIKGIGVLRPSSEDRDLLEEISVERNLHRLRQFGATEHVPNYRMRKLAYRGFVIFAVIEKKLRNWKP